MNFKKHQGFSLVELIVVIAIMAVLVGVAIPVYTGYIERSRDAASMQNADTAYRQYAVSHAATGMASELFLYVEAPDRVLAIQNGKILSKIFRDIPSAVEELTKNLPKASYSVTATDVEKLYAVIAGTPGDWSDASVVFVGDSITAGVGTEKAYHTFIQETGEFGSVDSRGIGGSCISERSDYGASNTPLIRRYAAIPHADLIVIFMGTNDYGHETPLGSPSDTIDVSFYGALNVIIPGILANHPRSQLVFVTPLHRYGFGTSKLLNTPFTDDSLPNGRGHTLGDYVNAIKTACASYGVPVIDLFNSFPADPKNPADRETYFPDGLHPNRAGHEILAEQLLQNLRLVPERTPSASPPAPDTGNAVIPLQHGNKFVSSYANDPTRASSVTNLYLEAGQTITFKAPQTYRWALAFTDHEDASNYHRYYPENGWNSVTSFTVTQSGYYGLVLLRNDGKAFSFGSADPGDVSAYISIE
ncbi:MAG: prepilin-type N-terminal cleavage/methylation domain-containing protein [Ruminococcaceae bacterium]|nr:prepilin-type N-terminal cleavage/methylation domain-containing protein [Oscillospiraceae bacterium]